MTVSPIPRQPETVLQKERRIFRKQLRRIANCTLNKIFELTVRGSQRRNQALIFLFLALGIFFTIRAHPLTEWGGQLSLVFQYFFNPTTVAQNFPNIPADFINFAFGAIFAPKTLRLLPIFLLPFYFALRAAATYLADIFELEKIETATEFIVQVALTGSRKKLHIGKGDVVDSDKNSPVYLIGGPGRVIVELDTAALFEKPNGQPRVIGPTTKGMVTLEGFERFRQAIDLRDQYTDSLDVKSRSLDGVPVSTKDVRLLFSVYRGGNTPSALSPHPFDERAIQTLVYGQASRVVLEGPYPSEPPSSWTGTIQGLIRGALGGFMSRHRLAEYLASIGLPEVEEARKRENEILKAGKIVLADGDNLSRRKVPPAPVFYPRTAVSNLFGQFAVDFSKNASKRGVQLSWIGVGTWKTPNEIVPEKHLEAWRLSRENLGRGSQGALNGLKKENQLQQTLRLVQSVPLARFHQNRDKTHKDIIQELLVAYREQLIEVLELLAKSNRPEPPIVRAAIKHIEGVLGIKHWVGAASSKPGSDAPHSAHESSESSDE